MGKHSEIELSIVNSGDIRRTTTKKKSFDCLLMKLAQLFVLGALACVLVMLELPLLNGKYLLVELADTNEIVTATRTTTAAPAGRNSGGPRGSRQWPPIPC